MPSVVVERRGGVLEIILNRPEILNAVNRETIAALADAVAEAAEDRAARVVLLRGAGTHFCAGGDITMFADLIRLPRTERQTALYRIVDTLHPLLVRMRHMPKPVVAVVQGAAAGFGLSLVLAADLALAAEDTVFTSGYIHLGTSPDGGMTATLPHVVGIKRAAELMLLGDRFDAQRALALGLVNRVVPADALETEAAALAARLAAGPRDCCRRRSATPSTPSYGARRRALPPVRQPRILPRVSAPLSTSAGRCSPAKGETVMRKYRRVLRAALIALVGAGALSGCYYDPYTGYWYAYPPYYPYPMAYPYGPGYPYPYPPGPRPGAGQVPAPGYGPGPGPDPGQGYAPGSLPPTNAPVQQSPLPPPS